MPVKKYPDSPGNSCHAAYNAWWRAKTGKKYKDSPAALKRKYERRKANNRYDHAGRPRTGDLGRPIEQLSERPRYRPRYPRTCGVRAGLGAGHNQKYEPNIVIDRSSPTLLALDARLAEIDRLYRGKL